MWQLREIVASTFALLALGCSIASQINIRNYSLPFSTVIPLLNLIFAVALLAFTFLSRSKRLSHNDQPQIFLSVLLAYVALLVPVVLAVLSATSVFSADARTCSSELQWKNWYVGKNEAMIRSIQNTLRCCGFNSMADRAWPFPSRETDARTCQRTSGFQACCAPLWKQQLQVAAVLCILASMFLHFAVVLLCFDILKLSYPQSINSSQDTNNERVRLLDSTTADDMVEATFEEERRRQIGQGLPSAGMH